MSIRRPMTARRATTAVAITAGLVLSVVGCSSGGDGDEPEPKQSSKATEEDDGEGKDGPSEPEGDQVLAEVKGGDSITLTIKAASREGGGFITVEGTVTNGSGSLWVAPGWQGDESELSTKNGASMAGAKLVDKEGKKRYFILRDTEGRCLCTTFRAQGVKPGETKTWYAQFPAPPEGNNKVDFQIADMPPASITISEG